MQEGVTARRTVLRALLMGCGAGLVACRPGSVPAGTELTQSVSPPPDALSGQRVRMVDLIKRRDIRSERVLDAMTRVPRHRFVPPELERAAYDDTPLPIGHGQTISQPYIVAFMTEALAIEPGHRVLEIGTGSGYQAAVLAELAREVYTIEIIPELGAQARTTLHSLGYTNIHVKIGNGYEGWPRHAPFDGIVVTAAPEAVPQALVDQLAMNGKMAIPVGRIVQEMRLLTKTPDGISERTVFPVRFVPMVGSPGKK